MVKRISTLDVRGSLGDLLNRVALRHDEYIIERKGKPLAVMVPVEKWEQMKEVAKLQLTQATAAKRPTVNQREADRLADEAKHATRKRR
jgi:prevent-host-death family protein